MIEVNHNSEALNGYHEDGTTPRDRKVTGNRIYTHTAKVEVYWDDYVLGELHPRQRSKVIFVDLCLHELLDPELREKQVRDEIVDAIGRGDIEWEVGRALAVSEQFKFQILNVQDEG